MTTNENRKGIYFSSLQLGNVKCFRDPITVSFLNRKGSAWSRWTIILGDNGMGKTTLLQTLAGGDTYEANVQHGTIKIGYYQATGNKESIKTAIEMEADTYSEPAAVVLSYGANRRMGKPSQINNLLSKNTSTLFDDNEPLISAEEWLLVLDYAASKESPVKDFLARKRASVNKILLELLPGIHAIKILDPTIDQLKPGLAFQTDFGWLNIHQLSLGYRSMIAWVVDLIARMYLRYPQSENSLAEPAIVLVDGIDLHLHPKWQRNLFTSLSTCFPAVQFIVTANSPVIVQAAPEDANIVLLQKMEDTVIIDQEITHAGGWGIDQILTCDLFGIKSILNAEQLAIQRYREAKLALQNIVDIPDRYIDRMIIYLRQNNGVFPEQRREQFAKLTDEEIQCMQAAYRLIFGLE